MQCTSGKTKIQYVERRAGQSLFCIAFHTSTRSEVNLSLHIFFRNAPILHVIGRQHPVNIRHVKKSQDEWQSALLATIFQIHSQGKPEPGYFLLSSA